MSDRRSRLEELQHQWYIEKRDALFAERQSRHTDVELWFAENNFALKAALDLRLRLASSSGAYLFDELVVGDLFTIPPNIKVFLVVEPQIPAGYTGLPTAVLCYACATRANVWVNAYDSEADQEIHICPGGLVLKHIDDEGFGDLFQGFGS